VGEVKKLADGSGDVLSVVTIAAQHSSSKVPRTPWGDPRFDGI
jgi:hypothetical protein